MPAASAGLGIEQRVLRVSALCGAEDSSRGPAVHRAVSPRPHRTLRGGGSEPSPGPPSRAHSKIFGKGDGGGRDRGHSHGRRGTGKESEAVASNTAPTIRTDHTIPCESDKKEVQHVVATPCMP